MKFRQVGMFTILGLVTLACSKAASSETETVSVGFAHPFTGPLATQGVAFEQAVRLAQDQVNTHGGIRGKQIELVAMDTQTNGEVAGKVAEELLSQGVTAIVSGDGTAAIAAMLSLTVPARAVLVAGTAQTVSLARPENAGLFFRPGSNTLNEAGPLVATVVADGHSKIAAIASTLPYTGSLYGEFEKVYLSQSCGAAPCEIAFHETYPKEADLATFDFSALVQRALDSQPDALFLASYPADAKALLDAVWSAGYRGPIYTTMAAGNENLAPFLPSEQAAQIKWATVEEASGPSADFARSLWIDSGFRAEDFFGPVHSNYDGMFLLALALAHSTSLEGDAIAESMRVVANPPGIPIYAGDWAKALAAIENGEDIDYVGITSDVNFDDLGNNDQIVTIVKGYQGGEPVVLSRK